MTAKTEAGDRWERSPGYVYFIGAGDPPVAIKIGISTQRDIRRRLGTLQGGNHEPLAILGVIPFDSGDRPMLQAAKRETELHARFGELQRFRPYWAGAEWFNASAELVDFIRTEAVPPADRGLVASVATPGKGRP